MITVKNVRTLDGQVTDYIIPSSKDYTIEAREKLLLLPGVIDPHVCLGSLKEQNRNWDVTISFLVRGGITAVVEIPSIEMPCNNKDNILQKKNLIEKRLHNLQIPLSDYLYGKADLEEVETLSLSRNLIKGIVVLLDPNKREELDVEWESLFQMAASLNIPIIVNSANENSREEFVWGTETYLERAIYYAENQSAMLYVLNVSNQEEIDLIQAARKRSVLIYAETTPQHLFQKDTYQAECLWKALDKDIIETIGSGYHVDYQTKERIVFKGSNFSFLDPSFLLPLLLNACHEKKISIEKLVNHTSLNINDILRIERTHDAVLVDLEKEQTVQKVVDGRAIDLNLRGWPIYTIVQGQIFSPPQTGYKLVHPD